LCIVRATVVVPGNAQPAASSGMAAPEVAPNQQVPPRTFQKPADNSSLEPTPSGGTSPSGTTPSNGNDPLDDALKTNPSANYLEAPKLQLFNPNDRTASRVAAPVRNAIYEKPATYHPVSTSRVTAQQAQQDAVGWTSPSN
jgi:hypothetical protein